MSFPKSSSTEHPDQSSRVAGLGTVAALPGIGAALLPAVSCPACWPAYAGLLSSLGLGFIDYSPWLLPVMALFLGLSVAVLAWQGYRRHSYGPLAVGVIGVALIVVNQVSPGPEWLLYSGIGLLIVASLWNAWPRKVCAVEQGCHT